MSIDFKEWNRQIIEEFHANDGVVGGMFEGATVVLLHTTGAKSGKERVNPLMARLEGERLFVFASYAGAEHNPDWYHNLLAHPTVTVEMGTERFAATATVVDGAERAEVYARQAAQHDNFREYEEKTTRVIPVVELVR